MPMAATLARGIYPPVHPYYPDAPVSYHFAYDLLAAWCSHATGAPLDRIFDVLSALAVVCWILVVAALVRRFGGGRVAPYAIAIAVVWMMGLTWVRWLGAPALDEAHLGAYIGWEQLDGYEPLPPVLSYTMQKPVALGLPIWGALLMLLAQALDRMQIVLAVLAGVLLGFLELTQTALFWMTMAALLGIAVLRPRSRVPLMVFVIVGLGLGVARVQGGFLSNLGGQDRSAHLFLRIPAFAHTASRGSALSPYVWQMGIPILLAPIAVGWALLHRRNTAALFLAGFGGASLLVPHLVIYAHSNDTVKFFAFAQIAFALVLAMGAQARRWLLAALGIGLCAAAPLWFLFFLRYTPRWEDARNNPDVRLATDAAAALALHAGPRDKVLTSSMYPAALVGAWTPVPTMLDVPRRYLRTFGYDASQVDDLAITVERALVTLEPAALDQLGVRYLWLEGTDLARLTPQAQARLSDRSAFTQIYGGQRKGQVIVIFARNQRSL